MTEERDKKIARVFATPEGKDLLAEPWQELTREAIDAAIARERRRWATGAPALEQRYRSDRRAWAQEIGWPWP